MGYDQWIGFGIFMCSWEIKHSCYMLLLCVIGVMAYLLPSDNLTVYCGKRTMCRCFTYVYLLFNPIWILLQMMNPQIPIAIQNYQRVDFRPSTKLRVTSENVIFTSLRGIVGMWWEKTPGFWGIQRVYTISGHTHLTNCPVFWRIWHGSWGTYHPMR